MKIHSREATNNIRERKNSLLDSLQNSTFLTVILIATNAAVSSACERERENKSKQKNTKFYS